MEVHTQKNAHYFLCASFRSDFESYFFYFDFCLIHDHGLGVGEECKIVTFVVVD